MPIKKWIEDNKFENVFESGENICLIYRNTYLLFFSNRDKCYKTSPKIDNLIGYTDNTQYQSIEECLLTIDKIGVFKSDFRWQVIMKIF